MPEVGQANRRIHSRRTVRLPARLAHESDSIDGIVENIGEGGVFFATENLEMLLEEGASATLSFRCKKSGAEVRLERVGCILRTERHFDGERVLRTYAIRF